MLNNPKWDDDDDDVQLTEVQWHTVKQTQTHMPLLPDSAMCIAEDMIIRSESCYSRANWNSN